MRIDRVLIHPVFQNKLNAKVQGELNEYPAVLAERCVFGIKGLHFQVLLHQSVRDNDFWHTKVRQTKGVNIRIDSVPLGWYPELRIPLLDSNKRQVVLIDSSIRSRMPENDDPEKIIIIEVDERRQAEQWIAVRTWILAQVNQLIP